ncbi:MAG: hypothetical protein ACF8R7_05985 [Phycisphaerales bacterium JB039]
MPSRRISRRLPLALAGLLSVALAAPALAQRDRRAQPDPLHAHISTSVQALLDGLEQGAEIAPAIDQARALFDPAVAYGDADHPGAIRDAALAVRLLQQLSATTSVARGPLLRYLRQHGQLASTLAFMVQPEDEVDRVYWCLSRIVDQYPVEAADTPALTAAICVVHDGRVLRPHSPPTDLDPAPVFAFFDKLPNALLDFRSLPPEVLIYLANTRAAPQELEWVQAFIQPSPSLGKHYFEIDYDSAAFEGRAQPKLASAPGGYILPNIHRLGGVCVDQAYFAEHVGKAGGVPSMTSVGSAGEVGHAWLGYLRRQGGGYQWDFTDGRYTEYTDVRGTVRDPQTGQGVPEAAVNLNLRLIGVDRATVEQAVALADAARRLGEMTAYPPPAPAGVPGLEARPRDVDEQLRLLEAALQRAPGRRDLWEAVIPIAASGAMTTAQKRRWGDALLAFAGRDEPDFVIEILRPMFRSEPLETQGELWDWFAREVRRRPDLFVQSQIELARVAEQRGDLNEAFRILESAFNRHANDTAWATDAIFQADRLLRENGRAEELIPMYSRAFRRIRRPAEALRPSSLAGSTWMRVGRRYQELLQQAGQTRQAERIGEQLASVVREPDR